MCVCVCVFVSVCVCGCVYVCVCLCVFACPESFFGVGLKSLEKDVTELSQILLEGEKKQTVLNALERRVASRFKVIWSVFKAHS